MFVSKMRSKQTKAHLLKYVGFFHGSFHYRKNLRSDILNDKILEQKKGLKWDWSNRVWTRKYSMDFSKNWNWEFKLLVAVALSSEQGIYCKLKNNFLGKFQTQSIGNSGVFLLHMKTTERYSCLIQKWKKHHKDKQECMAFIGCTSKLEMFASRTILLVIWWSRNYSKTRKINSVLESFEWHIQKHLGQELTVDLILMKCCVSFKTTWFGWNNKANWNMALAWFFVLSSWKKWKNKQWTSVVLQQNTIYMDWRIKVCGKWMYQ